MEYTIQLVNRLKFPARSILIVEDSLLQQINFAEYLINLFGHEGTVRFNFVASAIEAGLIISNMHKEYNRTLMIDLLLPKLIILDHDLQIGNGVEFIGELKELDLEIPIITASGIPYNNDRLMEAGANYKFTKQEIFDGKATNIILEIMK